MLSMLLALSQYAGTVLQHLTAAALMLDGRDSITAERCAFLELLTVEWSLSSYTRL